MLRIVDDVRQLYFAAISPTGDTLLAPRTIDVPYDSYPRLEGTSEGWLLIMPGMRGTPARHVRIALNGSLVGALEPFDDMHELGDVSYGDELTHHPSAPLFAHVFQSPSGMLGS